MEPIALPQVQKEMIEKFQCPGCSLGCDTDCGSFRFENDKEGFQCGAWSPGTFIMPGGRLCLGLPTGFNKLGPVDLTKIRRYISMFASPEDISDEKVNPTDIFSGKYNKLNLPVWAMEKDGYLFVKVFSPRRNLPLIQIIKGGTFAMFDAYTSIPKPINVAEFVDQID